MKQLFSLALKYIRRQKLRSSLMFVCILISVFILNLFLVYVTSTIHSVRNEVIYDEGQWEVQLSNAMADCNNGKSSKFNNSDAAAIAASENIRVDKMYYSYSLNYDIFDIYSDETISFFDISFDNGRVIHSERVSQNKSLGDPDLFGRYVDDEFNIVDKVREGQADSAVLPYWIHDLGYNVGDRLTLTITPAVYPFGDSSQLMKLLRSKINELNSEDNGLYYAIEGEEDNVSVPDGKELHTLKKTALMQRFLDVSELKLTPEKSGEPVTLSITIAGFNKKTSIRSSSKSLILDMCGISKDGGPSIAALGNDELIRKESPAVTAAFVLDQDYDYDKAVIELINDLGFDGENYYYLSRTTEGFGENDVVLAANLRSVRAVASLVMYIALFLIILMILWFFSRFVIDNAFEISVQERSRQFASLRVMGASKRQIAVLVLAEGLFYSLTAVPAGVLLSVAAGKFVFGSLHRSGFPRIEFFVYPFVMIAGIFLCLIAVFISAYTSAMWASRKLSPAQILQFGAPSSKKSQKKLARMAKKQVKKKSKLRLGSKRFIVNYTLKNIFRTKKRFIVSSIAMAIGVLLFTYCLQLGMYLRGNKTIKKLTDETNGWDYVLDCMESSDTEFIDSTRKLFEDNENFSRCGILAQGWYEFRSKSDMKELDKLAHGSYSPSIDRYIYSFSAIDRYNFEQKNMFRDMKNINVSLSDTLGMTYDEFCNAGAILVVPLTGTRSEQQMSGSDFKLKYYPDYKPASAMGLGNGVDLNFEGMDHPIKITGVMHYGESPEIIFPIDRATEFLPDFGSAWTTISLTVSDTKHFEAAQAQIDKFTDEHTDIYVGNMYMGNTGLKTFVGAIIRIVVILMLSIWLAGVFSMMHSINTSVLNRCKELLMMRSVGMSRRQLLGTVVLESILFSAFSVIAGLILGKAAFVITLFIITKKWIFLTGTGMMLISAAISLLIAVAASLPGVKTVGNSIKQELM